MITIEKLFFLRKAPLLAGLGEQDLLQVAAIAVDMTFAPGETLFRQGDPGDSLYIILDGEVAIERDGVEVNVLGNGQFFGEVAVLADLPRSAGVVARSEVCVLCIARTDFLRLFEHNRDLRLNVVRELGRRVCEIGRRERQMTADEERRNGPGDVQQAAEKGPLAAGPF